MFISLEGIEGSGKTSQIPSLVEFLRENGYKVFPTREPGGTRIGELIRRIVVDIQNAEMSIETETLLFQAARAQFVSEIKVHLASSEVIITDRYADSTIAYQGYGHQQNIDEILLLVRYATKGLIPDLTILLDVDAEIGLERKNKKIGWNRLDSYSLEFHQRVRDGYLQIAQKDSNRWVIIDANKPFSYVQEQIRASVIRFINK